MLREETDSSAMRLAAKIWRKLFYREQWFLQMELPAGGDLLPNLSRCMPLYPPRDRFWADPFVFSTRDAHFVFVEEWLYAEGKGHIAVLELSRDGALINACKVLERPYHLSYPFIFQWQGVHYLLPESGANTTVELYRCTAFPDQWVLDRVLLSQMHTADATLFEHDGRWWLFMTQAMPGESIHEHLYLYWAETPLGPFMPHPGNPVKSGLRGTRPAGALFFCDDIVYRPAQDCTRVYGEAVVLQRVEELSVTTYRETEVGIIAPQPGAEARRVHTVNAGEGIRVLDGLRWIAR
jgi:hypothetical protein